MGCNVMLTKEVLEFFMFDCMFAAHVSDTSLGYAVAKKISILPCLFKILEEKSGSVGLLRR